MARPKVGYPVSIEMFNLKQLISRCATLGIHVKGTDTKAILRAKIYAKLEQPTKEKGE